MADPIEELNAVFATIGIMSAAMHTTIINQEGFTSLKDLAVLASDHKDVDEMAKRMANRTQAEGRILLGTITIQCLKALVWWVADQKKRCLPLVAANFMVAVMEQAEMERIFCQELAAKEPVKMDLGKFDPNDFDMY